MGDLRLSACNVRGMSHARSLSLPLFTSLAIRS